MWAQDRPWKGDRGGRKLGRGERLN
jgi:hypothetical protein